ncbi:hypothetical protein RUM44_007393 [Polyplax serrata]|uniref:Secreted protein n=1 Tax=Polyplax serrata TaxID=468196 RepID=A0ABR1B0J5_POLSC
MALHCMVHGLFGITLVITTYYKNENSAVNSCAIAAATCFILMGSKHTCTPVNVDCHRNTLVNH